MKIDFSLMFLVIAIISVILAAIVVSPSLFAKQAQSWGTGLIFIALLSFIVSILFFLISEI